MPKNLPIIQDKAIIANVTKSNPIGEAFTKKLPVPLFPISMLERQNMVQRLEDSISQLMDGAQRTYQDNCYKPGTMDIDGNYITRLSTNEFFFYTEEPLTLKRI